MEYVLGETNDTVYDTDIHDATTNPEFEYYFIVTWTDSQQSESPPSNIIGTASYSF